MFRILLISLLFLLLTCYQAPYVCDDFFTQNGIDFCISYEGSVDKEIIDLTIKETEAVCNYYYPQIFNIEWSFASEGVFVRVIDDILAYDCYNTEIPGVMECDFAAAGINQYGHKIIVMNKGKDPCLGHTALAHELLHSIQRFYDLDFGGHETDYFFIEKYTGEDRLNTIEHKVNAKMRVYCAQRKVF